MMIRDVKMQSSEKDLGKTSTKIRIMLIESIITPTILANTETWCNITHEEERLITSLHHQVLARTLGLPRSTPYFGIIAELNITPYIDIIWIKKYLWYFKLIK